MLESGGMSIRLYLVRNYMEDRHEVMTFMRPYVLLSTALELLDVFQSSGAGWHLSPPVSGWGNWYKLNQSRILECKDQLVEEMIVMNPAFEALSAGYGIKDYEQKDTRIFNVQFLRCESLFHPRDKK